MMLVMPGTVPDTAVEAPASVLRKQAGAVVRLMAVLARAKARRGQVAVLEGLREIREARDKKDFLELAVEAVCAARAEDPFAARRETQVPARFLYLNRYQYRFLRFLDRLFVKASRISEEKD